jgi:hypothetical protein
MVVTLQYSRFVTNNIVESWIEQTIQKLNGSLGWTLLLAGEEATKLRLLEEHQETCHAANAPMHVLRSGAGPMSVYPLCSSLTSFC